MAAGAFSNGIERVLNGGTDLDTTELKALLYQSSYTFDPDQATLDNATADDLASHEANCTGYTGGHAGVDRNVITCTVTEQTANNRVVCIFSDESWTALGGASNNTLEGMVVFDEVTADTDSVPIANLEFSATVTTNGSDITVDCDGTDGNLRFTV